MKASLHSLAENGLKFAHFAAETYDPRKWDGKGADASFEPGMDREGRFSRVWIEHQSPARIGVRVQYALNNSKYDIAHDDSYLKGTMWLVNPAFVVKNWNQPEAGFRIELDGKALANGTRYRFGFEQTVTGRDLVIWLNKTLDLNASDERRAEIAIVPQHPKGN